MKTVKAIFHQNAVSTIFAFAFVLFSFTMMNYKTIVRSIDIDETSHVIFTTNDEVNVEYWDKDYINIQTNIRADKIRPQMMPHFIQLNVFDFGINHQSDTMMISTYGQEKMVFMNGVEVSWDVDYTIYTPTHVIIETRSIMDDQMLIVSMPEI